MNQRRRLLLPGPDKHTLRPLQTVPTDDLMPPGSLLPAARGPCSHRGCRRRAYIVVDMGNGRQLAVCDRCEEDLVRTHAGQVGRPELVERWLESRANRRAYGPI